MGNRQCTVEIENKCSVYTLCNPKVFIVSGIYEKSLPPSLGPSESGSGRFIKTANTACGAVGVLTYDLQNDSTEKCDGKLAVMYSVPYDYNVYYNWFAVGVFDVNTDCDYSLYHEMYYGAERGFARGNAKDKLTYTGKDVTIKATMTDRTISLIKVQVFPASAKHQ
ncbi:DELTA-sagatoxin-Srs1a-like [Micropterus salmoides]|uniref:DELTA-sagatoxin-Srs1a-like n=1 Tax=Micropterus salmoides TaxID=27706 RepID=UPI0018EA55E5|nr:DELTA-sagatoxin-Srs1a-like [Micropterus salmoides]